MVVGVGVRVRVRVRPGSDVRFQVRIKVRLESRVALAESHYIESVYVITLRVCTSLH